MNFEDYTITHIQKEKGDVIIFHLKRADKLPVFDFLPGQFCRVQNPDYKTPGETHLFSIASSPKNKDYIELCIKVYGYWTQDVAQKKVGDSLKISGPYGKFIWDNTISHAVFLAGGIGISPMLSMLRYIEEEKSSPQITLIYGSRTVDTICYKNELEKIEKEMKNLHIIHILSHLKPEDPWTGYRGFITKEILTKEVDFTGNPTFFICGPPIFVKLMNDILKNVPVDKKHIRQELFS